MLKSLRTTRCLAGLTLFSLLLSVAAPIVRACDMGRMDEMHANTETRTGHEGHSVAGAADVSPMCAASAESVPPQRTVESCCDEQAAGTRCRPASVETMPFFCSCGNADANAPADRTRDMTEASLALDVSGRALPHPREVTGLAPTRANTHASVPDRTILYGCFLI